MKMVMMIVDSGNKDEIKEMFQDCDVPGYTEIPDVLLLEPDVHGDERGFFLEYFHTEHFQEYGLDLPFVQLNHSRSEKGTLRGLHYQLAQPQGKLVQVITGEVFDVAVDIRTGSPTFGNWTGQILSSCRQTASP